MPIPDFQYLMLPMLQLAADGAEHRVSAVIEALAQQFQLSEAEGGQSDRALLQFGHRNDQRPDLLQCKQTLATLDPGGVPLRSATVAGNRADDPRSVPTWQDLVALRGHANFLLVADCKAAALTTRATLAAGDGR